MKLKLLAPACLVLALAGCSDPEPPRTLEALSPSITNVRETRQDNRTILYITIKQDSIFSGANDTKDILQGLMRYFHGKQFDEVKINMVERLVDRYGKESLEPIVELTFPRADLEKMNFANLVGWDVLNLSQPARTGPYAMQVLQQECAEENNAKYAADFCAQALQ